MPEESLHACHDAHRAANELYQTGKVSYDAAVSASGDPFRVEVLRQLTELTSCVRDIQSCLIGNRLGTTGLVQRMADAEKAIEEERNRVNIKLAKAGTLMTVLGVLFTGICAWWEGRH